MNSVVWVQTDFFAAREANQCLRWLKDIVISCVLLGVCQRCAIALFMIWGGGDDCDGDCGSGYNVSIDADDDDHNGCYSYCHCTSFFDISYYPTLLFFFLSLSSQNYVNIYFLTISFYPHFQFKGKLHLFNLYMI